MIEQTKQIITDLKCFGMLSHLDERLAEATSHGWGHTEFLSAVLSDEKLYRDNHRTARRIKAAHFRTDASFERLDLTAKRTLTKTQVQDLKEMKFITEPRNVLLIGHTGTGKTYLATAIGNYACRQGYSCLFFGMSFWMEKILLHRADGTYLKFRERLIQTDLLIFDDLGIKSLSPGAIQDFYDILEERYHAKSTLITTQLPLENWKEVIEDKVALDAILDRLIHGSIKIEIEGDTVRKVRGKMNSRLDAQRGPVEIAIH